ncbi:hypothetical protein [Moorena producens]|uniref:hypothetical protein n=1 Tax=Moorena producens TaxID=1155739 RepID=UPI001E37297A|nr:hypothetical protein [Moorena producens]
MIRANPATLEVLRLDTSERVRKNVPAANTTVIIPTTMLSFALSFPLSLFMITSCQSILLIKYTSDTSLFPIPCSLFPVPYSLFPIPYSLFTDSNRREICEILA